MTTTEPCRCEACGRLRRASDLQRVADADMTAAGVTLALAAAALVQSQTEVKSAARAVLAAHPSTDNRRRSVTT